MDKFVIKDVKDVETNQKADSVGAKYINEKVTIVAIGVGRGMRLATEKGLLTTSTVLDIEDTGAKKIVKTRNSIYDLEAV